MADHNNIFALPTTTKQQHNWAAPGCEQTASIATWLAIRASSSACAEKLFALAEYSFAVLAIWMDFTAKTPNAIAEVNVAICSIMVMKNWPRGGERVAVAFSKGLFNFFFFSLEGGDNDLFGVGAGLVVFGARVILLLEALGVVESMGSFAMTALARCGVFSQQKGNEIRPFGLGR